LSSGLLICGPSQCANHENAHPKISLVVSALQPALRHVTPRRTGFKSDTTMGESRTARLILEMDGKGFLAFDFAV